LKYYYNNVLDYKIRVEPHIYRTPQPEDQGTRATFVPSEWGDADYTIPYLKLHGSLNWERGDKVNKSSVENDIPTKASLKPFILPPVFNKLNDVQINQVWNEALNLLRQAKNLIIVGYSLPSTDVYMQYFLKSGVGPNGDLNKIIVFDPILFNDDEKPSNAAKIF
jgi:hypothetical protein